MSTLYQIPFLVFACVLGTLELLAYLYAGTFSFLASRLWLFSSFLYLIFTLCYCGGAIINSLKKGRAIPVALVALILALVFYGIGDVSKVGINFESTQQVGQILNYNIEKADFAYTEPAFLGYPSRQYFLAAIPSIIFGRDILWNQLGYAIQFSLGFICLLFALRTYFDDLNEQNKDLISIFFVVGSLSFPYLVAWIFAYEQTILPLSFTMQALAWLLIVLKSPRLPWTLNLAWSGSMLGTSYTPALSVWAFLLLILLFQFIKSFKSSKVSWLWLGLLIWIFAFGACSFLTRVDLSIHTTSKLENNTLIESALEGLRIIFLYVPKGFISPILFLPVVLYLFCSLLGLAGTFNFILAAWCLAVFIVSSVLRGYAAPPPIFGLHRAIVIIPVLLFGLINLAQTHVTDLASKRLRVPTFCLLLLLALYSIYNYHIVKFSYSPGPKDLFTPIMQEFAAKQGINHTELTFVQASTCHGIENIADYFVYFFPKWRIINTTDFQNSRESITTPLLILTDKSLAMEGLSIQQTPKVTQDIELHMPARSCLLKIHLLEHFS